MQFLARVVKVEERTTQVNIRKLPSGEVASDTKHLGWYLTLAFPNAHISFGTSGVKPSFSEGDEVTVTVASVKK